MATFGKNILENITTGMYYDSKVIYREYIQNACDQIDKAEETALLSKGAGAVDIAIEPKSRTITIHDNATGIPHDEFRRQLEDIANSEKVRGKDKGFRGIGRLCGLAYCKTLTFRATACGEDTLSVMEMDAKKMREMLASPERYTVDDILQAITKFSIEKADTDEHSFTVCLEGINSENTDLLDKDEVIKYLSFVAPAPYNNKFRLCHKIYEHAKEIGYHIDEYKIYVEGAQIFKEYGMRLYDKTNAAGMRKPYDELIDVAFKDFYQDSKLVAWMWYGLCRFDKAIPKSENPMYGFRVRQSNIQIGDNTVLAKFFKEDRGNSYFVGEVFAVSSDLVPNSQRDNFNESPTRVYYEDEIQKYCFDTLNKLYNMAAKLKNNFKRLTEYATIVDEFESKKQKGFINDGEKINLEKRLSEAEERKNDAQKVIAKIPEGNILRDNPTFIVQDAIREHFNQKEAEQRAFEAEKKKNALVTEDEGKPKYFTDSLSGLDKNKRKLVAQVIGIVAKHTDEETLSQIKADIEKEFR